MYTRLNVPFFVIYTLLYKTEFHSTNRFMQLLLQSSGVFTQNSFTCCFIHSHVHSHYILTFLLKTFDTLLTSLPCYKAMSIRHSHSHISLHPSYRLLCGYIFVNT